jgi:hypothetical protein
MDNLLVKNRDATTRHVPRNGLHVNYMKVGTREIGCILENCIKEFEGTCTPNEDQHSSKYASISLM